MVAITALRELPLDPTADQLRGHLSHMKGFAGVNGPYDFEAVPQRGLSEDAVVVAALWNREVGSFEIVSRRAKCQSPPEGRSRGRHAPGASFSP